MVKSERSKKCILYQRLYYKFCKKHSQFKSSFNVMHMLAVKKKRKEEQYLVAKIFLNPKHNECQKNIKKGIKYLTLSADQSYIPAAYKLAKCFLNGKYVKKKDVSLSIKYLTIGEKMNDVKSIYLLGKIYYKGIGILPNHKKAFDYFRFASNKGHIKSTYYCCLDFTSLSIKNEEKDHHKKVLEEAANKEYPNAQYLYGKLLYQNSKRLNRDTQNDIHTNPLYLNALKYIKLAADSGYSPARNFLNKYNLENIEELILES